MFTQCCSDAVSPKTLFFQTNLLLQEKIFNVYNLPWSKGSVTLETLEKMKESFFGRKSLLMHMCHSTGCYFPNLTEASRLAYVFLKIIHRTSNHL